MAHSLLHALVFLALFLSAFADLEALCPTTSIDAAGLESCVNALRGNVSQFFPFMTCDTSAIINETQGLLRRPLRFDERLAGAAQEQAEYMANTTTLSQKRDDGKTFWDITAEHSFYSFPQGQNIAKNFRSSRALLLAWACSAPHRNNLLRCDVDVIGTGLANATTDGGLYISEIYGCSLTGICECDPVPDPTSDSPAAPAAEAPLPPQPAPAPAPATTPGGSSLLPMVPAPQPLDDSPAPAPETNATPATPAQPAPAPDSPAAATPAPAPASSPTPLPEPEAAAPAPSPTPADVPTAEAPSTGTASPIPDDGQVIPAPTPTADVPAAPTDSLIHARPATPIQDEGPAPAPATPASPAAADTPAAAPTPTPIAEPVPVPVQVPASESGKGVPITDEPAAPAAEAPLIPMILSPEASAAPAAPAAPTPTPAWGAAAPSVTVPAPAAGDRPLPPVALKVLSCGPAQPVGLSALSLPTPGMSSVRLQVSGAAPGSQVYLVKGQAMAAQGQAQYTVSTSGCGQVPTGFTTGSAGVMTSSAAVGASGTAVFDYFLGFESCSSGHLFRAIVRPPNAPSCAVTGAVSVAGGTY